MPARAVRGGNPSPQPTRAARAGFFLFVVCAVVAGLAFAFELGHFFGHREGVEYAEERAWMVELATLTLTEAVDSTRACHDIAQYLKGVSNNPKATRWRLHVAKRTLSEPCKNCGGVE